MNTDDKNLDKKLKARANAFAKTDQKMEDKKVKDLERSIEYLNYFLSRKIDKKEA